MAREPCFAHRSVFPSGVRFAVPEALHSEDTVSGHIDSLWLFTSMYGPQRDPVGFGCFRDLQSLSQMLPHTLHLPNTHTKEKGWTPLETKNLYVVSWTVQASGMAKSENSQNELMRKHRKLFCVLRCLDSTDSFVWHFYLVRVWEIQLDQFRKIWCNTDRAA